MRSRVRGRLARTSPRPGSLRRGPSQSSRRKRIPPARGRAASKTILGEVAAHDLDVPPGKPPRWSISADTSTDAPVPDESDHLRLRPGAFDLRCTPIQSINSTTGPNRSTAWPPPPTATRRFASITVGRKTGTGQPVRQHRPRHAGAKRSAHEGVQPARRLPDLTIRPSLTTPLRQGGSQPIEASMPATQSAQASFRSSPGGNRTEQRVPQVHL